jgi:hypothetical protein
MPIVTNLFFAKEDHSFWIYIPAGFAYLLALPFVYALLIPAMDAADRGSAQSFTGALAAMAQHLWPIFGYVLLSTGLIYIATLPSSAALIFYPYSGFVVSILLRVKDALMYALLAMIVFIPVIAVVRRASFASAFDSCIELWARNAKNAVAFVGIGALLLLVPVTLEGRIFRLFSSFVGWKINTTVLVLSVCKVAAGVFIMSSMVVFYRKIQEAEAATPEGKE